MYYTCQVWSFTPVTSLLFYTHTHTRRTVMFKRAAFAGRRQNVYVRYVVGAAPAAAAAVWLDWRDGSLIAFQCTRCARKKNSQCTLFIFAFSCTSIRFCCLLFRIWEHNFVVYCSSYVCSCENTWNTYWASPPHRYSCIATRKRTPRWAIIRAECLQQKCESAREHSHRRDGYTFLLLVRTHCVYDDVCWAHALLEISRFLDILLLPPSPRSTSLSAS